MGTCSYFSVEERDFVTSIPLGVLVKTTERLFESQHPNGDYDRPARRTGGGLTTNYYFCSKQQPAMVSKIDGKWLVSFLGSVASPSGVMTSATIAYFYVCHGVNAKDASTETFARKFGYRTDPDEDFSQTPAAAPEDVLKLAVDRNKKLTAGGVGAR